MFHLKQAALLSIQLLLICHVFAGHYPDEHRNILVSRGDPVMFTCNHDDTGLYRCDVNGVNGTSTATWNLTVSEKPEEMTDFHSWYLLYILTTVTGLLLCGITSAVCLCRIRRTRTQNQDSAQDQFHLQSGGEVVLTQLQDDTDSRRNNKRSQYMERLNSIYGF
ncbi:uncharacterized protein LOC111218572 isoform X3 [Seriola dumerili]|uniref:uncharacterized protein LOC111218572 isoform X3 n=1 Tax=Seriola dumerili TaxID=41447 RepID=UPI000BBE2ED2|nr:uncharacterized protein LOC111218572 isoform X3 [Seriola dumerili]